MICWLETSYTAPMKFQISDRVWVYTPRNCKGLSKKLAHNYHGPYRIVQFLSPVHCILRAVDNRRVSTMVHVSRLKRCVSTDLHIKGYAGQKCYCIMSHVFGLKFNTICRKLACFWAEIQYNLS